MSEQVKSGIRNASEIIQTVVLSGLTVALCFMFNAVINHGNALAVHNSQIHATETRVTTLEDKGSRSLETHVREDDTRVVDLKARLDKVEAAVLLLQSMPGEIRAANVRLDAIRDGQTRIEKSLDEHMKKP